MIQAPVRKKDLQQVPFSLSASTSVISTVNKLGLLIRTSGELTAWYDSDTTKTWTLEADVDHTIVIDPATTTLTISGTATKVEVGFVYGLDVEDKVVGTDEDGNPIIEEIYGGRFAQ